MDDKVLVGRAAPGSPAGDILVSQALIAQRGIGEVRRMVRAIYDSAYRAAARRRRDPGRIQKGPST